MKIVKKIDQHLEEYLCIGLFSLMTLLVTIQILARVFNYSLEWTEESSRFTFIWLVYMGISLAAKHGRHIRIEVVQNLIAKKTGNIITHLTDLCWLGFNIYMIFYGSKMVQLLMGSIQVAPVTRLNMGYVYLIIPVGFTLMSIRIIQNMWKRKLQFPGFNQSDKQNDQMNHDQLKEGVGK